MALSQLIDEQEFSSVPVRVLYQRDYSVPSIHLDELYDDAVQRSTGVARLFGSKPLQFFIFFLPVLDFTFCPFDCFVILAKAGKTVAEMAISFMF